MSLSSGGRSPDLVGGSLSLDLAGGSCPAFKYKPRMNLLKPKLLVRGNSAQHARKT